MNKLGKKDSKNTQEIFLANIKKANNINNMIPKWLR